jgi:PAS domain S-box-containing protein
MVGTLDPVIADVISAVNAAPVSVALLDLDTRRLLAISPVENDQIHARAGDNIDEALAGEIDAEQLEQLFSVLRSGSILAYAARSPLHHPDGEERLVWVRSLESPGGGRYALICPFHSCAPTTDSFQALADVNAVVGRVGRDGGVRAVTRNVADLLGYAPDDVIGRTPADLVHPADLDRVLDASARAAKGATALSVTVRVQDANGEWKKLNVLIGPPTDANELVVAAAASVAFTTADNGNQAERVAQLERHLVRIAGEVEAAGLLLPSARVPDPERIPGLRDLTPRQWDILTRLLRGDRVQTIASDLYLSASTVRNHLSVIYRKTGVRSQAELLAKLRAADAASEHL